MYKPTVPYTPHIYKNYQNRFGGYNHTSSCGEGEIYDMKNIGHEEFPVLTPRRGRNTAPAFDNGRIFPAYSETEIVRPEIVGIYSFDDAYVLEKALVIAPDLMQSGSEALHMIRSVISEFEAPDVGNTYNLSAAKSMTDKCFGINKYITNGEGRIVRNDIKYYIKYADYQLDMPGYLNTLVDNGTITVKDNDVVALPQSFIQIAGAARHGVTNYYYYKRTNDTWEYLGENTNANWEIELSNISFKNGTYKDEAAAANTIAVTVEGDMLQGQVGDGIAISKCTVQPKNNKTAVIKETAVTVNNATGGTKTTELRFYENTFTLVDGNKVIEPSITISRKAPELDYMCQCNNRLFGCKGDTIYASKLGDPYNWNVFEGISTDSYSVEVGSSGDFTGCYAYEGDVLFFKEERIYKLLYTDSSPENWALVEIETYGVKAGCDRSLAVADSRLFWYSPKGMMQYGGSLPVSIAEPFGEQEYINAVAGSDGKDYYVCLTDKAGVPALFVFDTTHNIWFKHDNINVKSFVYHKGDLTALIKKDNGDTEVIRIGQKQPETPIDGEWNDMDSMIEFGDTLYETADKKNKMNLFAVAEVEEGGELKFYLSTDGDEYQLVGEIKGKCKKQIHRFSNVPVRCDYYRIKVEGKGMWKIHAISNGYVPGSDI